MRQVTNTLHEAFLPTQWQPCSTEIGLAQKDTTQVRSFLQDMCLGDKDAHLLTGELLAFKRINWNISVFHTDDPYAALALKARMITLMLSSPPASFASRVNSVHAACGGLLFTTRA